MRKLIIKCKYLLSKFSKRIFFILFKFLIWLLKSIGQSIVQQSVKNIHLALHLFYGLKLQILNK